MDEFKVLLTRGEDGRWQVHPAAPFPSAPSARWWVQQHGREAIEAGALIKHLGAWRVHPAKLAAVCIEVARRQALRAADRHSDGLKAAA